MLENEKICLSCSMPLSFPEAKGPSDIYCVHCTDKNGNLILWEDAIAGTAAYLDSWQNVGLEESRRRAILYLSAMPAWTDRKAYKDL
ncbi:hypothetical protein I2492_01690 [Budviciaceae bacterium CWB-B4]|uniref:Putative zinc ribbon domain-containing protein n=1 Tax=Limnobaculum xujianqingii TaxID=2738837 RepID=A0A9D7FQK4_9GAMM|nr:hypothetical protein [Limnobaculum xujianqingii]MBK5071728.1 hypothetical protein [Limnobaculum xujianqingii]MBK5175037.1 hypothetical protein [Limnobaculum xujianqingii]